MYSIKRVVFIFVYFRAVVSGALRNPIGLSGLAHLAFWRDWSGVLVLILSFTASFSFVYGTLTWRGLLDKVKVARFLEVHRGSSFVHVPTAEFAQYFDFGFIIPSYYRPPKMIDFFMRNRVHVFIVKRGNSSPIKSASAFTSPVSLDTYIFLRDNLEKMSEGTRFRIIHELGHAAAFFQSVAQRNTIGLRSIYLSILWLFLIFPWNSLVIGCGVAMIFLTIIFMRPVFSKWRKRERLNSELIADYMAMRHLPRDMIDSMISNKKAFKIVQDDPSLSCEDNAERKAVVCDQFERLRRGEDIDIPEVYLKEVFNHPIKVILFLTLHFVYVITVSSLYDASLLPIYMIAFVLLLYLIIAHIFDARYRIYLLKIVGVEGTR